MDAIVIGSGPAGIAVAKALLARGRKITLIDGGKTLEPNHQEQRKALAARQPETWSSAQIDAGQARQFATPAGQVRRYGSDFAMEPAQATISDGAEWLALRASRAAGGLSNLWGAAILPYRQQDIADWPITIDALAPHYRTVAGYMPVSARRDDLADLMPAVDVSGASLIAPGVQASKVLARLDRRRDRLRQLGVWFGAARTAVDADCKACGMCLHGCPWQYIYSTGRTLNQLQTKPNFSYRPGQIARSFGEDVTGASVSLVDGRVLRANRVFVAAGVLETARLVLASHPGTGRSLTLLDSQHMFVPMLHRWRARPRPDRMPMTTLPQMFLEIDAPEVSPHLVHSQLYTWNENFARDLIANYGHGLAISAPVLRAMARRLIVAQMFLHSDHSAGIELRLAADGRLSPTLKGNPATEPVLAAARAKLSRAMAYAGLTTLGFAARPGPVGSSFHVGGTVPMSTAPVDGQSDVIGRPYGLERIHLVDASVFPSIPATTITYSAMANASRIGALAP
jgi:choline dehydrogenase-like flavoprotein